MDGIIRGHIHHPVITEFGGLVYANCGDWVESRTALAEDADGSISLIHWVDQSFQLLDGRQEHHAYSDSDGCLVSTN